MADDDLMRFGVTMPRNLLEQLDKLVDEQGYSSRSDFIRRLARQALVQREFESGNEQVVGTLTLVYEHRRVNLGHKLNDIQHKHLSVVISSLHVHLSGDDCLEVLVLQGESQQVRALADDLKCLRGVKLAKLSVASSAGPDG